MADDLKKYLGRFDFIKMGSVLSAGIRECMANAATKYPDDEFYGFALDCNFSVGAIFFSLAPKSHLLRIANASRLLPDDALEVDALRSKVWSLGDWPLYCVNEQLAPKFVEAWQPWEALIEKVGYHDLYKTTLDVDLSVAFNSQLSDWAAGVLLECEADGAIDVIRRMPGFRTIVLDHDEDIDVGLDRMDRIKQLGA